MRNNRFFSGIQTGGLFAGMGRSLPDGVLAEVARELGTMLASGVPLSRALLIFSEDPHEKAAVRKVFRQVFAQICQGTSLWKAMEMQSPAFPAVMIQCVRAAEETGNLARTLLELSEDYSQEHQLRTQLRTAVLYPKILLVLLAGEIWILLCVILPQFEPLFAYMDELPGPTRFLYGLADVIRYRWPVLAAGAAGAVLLEQAAGRLEPVMLQRDRMRLAVPVLGPLRVMVCTARFARVLSALYEAGIPMPQGLQTAGRASGNRWMEKQAKEAAALVEEGENLSEALEETGVFPAKLIFIARAGEEAGQLGAMLRSASRSIEYDGRQALRRLASCAEPGMILLMALLIGFVMAAVLMPVYGSYEGIGNMVY